MTDMHFVNSWPLVRLGDVCTTSSGGTPTRGVSSYYGGRIPWVKSGELNDGLVAETEETITDEGIKNSSAKVFTTGTLLIALYGATVGKLGILGMDAATNQAVCAIFTGNQVKKDFLFLLLLGKRQELLTISTGGAQPNISQELVRNLQIPLPPLAEQERIAARLTAQMACIAEARQAAAAQLAAVRELPAAYLREVFEGEEAQEWETQRVEKIATIHAGQHILESDYNRIGEGIGYLTGPADFGPYQPVVSRWTTAPKAWCKPDDILVTVKGAGVGKLNMAPDTEVAIGRQLMAVRAKDGVIDTAYLFQFMRTCFKSLQGAALGATIPGLGKEDIAGLLIPLPPLDVQKQIVARLPEQMQAAEDARRAAQARLDALDALPAAYLREAFSGQS